MSDIEQLPDIEARTYPVQVERRSKSTRVYLFNTHFSISTETVDNPPVELPQVGRLVLLRNDGVPAMAFRVLKDYPEKKQFAAKWLRRYGETKRLERGQEFEAVEKISDLVNTPLTAQDQNDLQELESPPPPAPLAEPSPSPMPAPLPSPVEPSPPEANAAIEPPPDENPPPVEPPPAPLEEPTPAPEPSPEAAITEPQEEAIPKPVPPTEAYDPELDAGTSPPPKSTTKNAEEETGELNDLSSIMVEEHHLIERDINAISLGAGYYRNNSATAGATFYTPGGLLRYSRTLRRIVYFNKKNLQDSISFDGALG
jgi:hypothetical protein